ncbi:MAG: phospholipid carrier-dependent glycosyltransferase [Verrucomicrobiae bacterium]|nr:phospholipid carrier-dependent glycosyltransferase [Verrucomicrobiae bacterium]
MSPRQKEPEFAHVFQPPRNASSRDWLTIVGCVVVALAVVGLGLRWAGRQDLEQFQDKLAYIVVWDLRLIGLLLLGAIALAWKNFKHISDAVPCGTKRWLAAICALGLVLTAFVAPRTNRLYYDEQIYQNVAQTIAYEGRALVCNEGTAEHGQYRCEEGQYNKQPAGWSFVVSVAFQLFGVHDWVAHVLNNLIFVGAVMIVFWTAVLLFRDHTTGLFAALVYALIPLNLLWSNTASSEPSAALTALLSVCATLLFIRQPSHPTCALAFLANVFAVQFRPESILVVAVNAMLILFLNPRLLREPRFYAWGILGAILLLPHAWHLFAVRGQNWGSEGDKFSLEVFRSNLPVNSIFYWGNQRFPVLFTVLAWIGLASFAPYRKKLPLLLWFVLFWGVFLFFYAGSYDYGVDSRFSVLSYAPLALLAGLGCGTLAGWLKKRPKHACAVAALPVLIVLCWIPFLPLVRAVTEEAWGARADVEYAKEFAALLPENSIVLTHNPNMLLLMGKNASQLSTVTYNQSHLDNDLFSRFNGGVYLHWNYWCNASDELQKSFAQKIVDQYHCTLIAERRVRDFRYALYQLERPTANPTGATN